MDPDALIKIDNLHFSYNGDNILNGVTIKILPGEIFATIGPSGSGKSTLLKLCAGLFYPKGGSIKIKGINIHRAPKDHVRKLRKKIGFIFQDAALMSNMCIFDNIALPLRYHTRLSESEIEKRVSSKMNLLQIERSFDHLLPAQLSLGLKKKVGFARALVMDPEIIFFDEITASLDSQTVEQITKIIKDLKDDLNVTSVIASGDVPVVSSIADRVALLKNGIIFQTKVSDESKSAPDR